MDTKIHQPLLRHVSDSVIRATDSLSFIKAIRTLWIKHSQGGSTKNPRFDLDLLPQNTKSLSPWPKHRRKRSHPKIKFPCKFSTRKQGITQRAKQKIERGKRCMILTWKLAISAMACPTIMPVTSRPSVSPEWAFGSHHSAGFHA